MSHPCAGKSKMFEDRTQAAEAIQICRACPLLEACRKERDQVQREAIAGFGYHGVWAGEWIGKGDPFIEPKKPGPEGAVDRLSEEQVRLVRERRAAGEDNASLAKEFGIRDQACRLLCSGELRPEAPGPITKRRQNRPRKKAAA